MLKYHENTVRTLWSKGMVQKHDSVHIVYTVMTNRLKDIALIMIDRYKHYYLWCLKEDDITRLAKAKLTLWIWTTVQYREVKTNGLPIKDWYVERYCNLHLRRSPEYTEANSNGKNKD